MLYSSVIFGGTGAVAWAIVSGASDVSAVTRMVGKCMVGFV
jgi:hypothetical protein